MTIELTPQLLITAGGVFTATAVIIGTIAKGVRWVDEQKAQSTEIKALREHHDKDANRLREEIKQDQIRRAEEQTLLTYGVLACLKGLREQGCNGPVTEAINKIEKYLNRKAHES